KATSAKVPETGDILSEDEIVAIVEELGDLVTALRDAEPEHKLDVYRGIGLRLTYEPDTRTFLDAVMKFFSTPISRARAVNAMLVGGLRRWGQSWLRPTPQAPGCCGSGVELAGGNGRPAARGRYDRSPTNLATPTPPTDSAGPLSPRRPSI